MQRKIPGTLSPSPAKLGNPAKLGLGAPKPPDFHAIRDLNPAFQLE
jgi:hypothetical protein